MDLLLQQVIDKPFKPSNFTVYSILEEDGFIDELEGMFNTKFEVSDFEYIMLDLSVKEKNGILYRMSTMMNRIKELRNLLEKEIQDGPRNVKARVYVDKKECYVFVAKLKEFDLKGRIMATKKGVEGDTPTPNIDEVLD